MVSIRLDLKCQPNCLINVDHIPYKVVILEVVVVVQRQVHCTFIKAQSGTSEIHEFAAIDWELCRQAFFFHFPSAKIQCSWSFWKSLPKI